MSVPSIAPHHVLIAGGGVAAIEALMALADRGERRLQVTLACNREQFVLRPQLVGELWGGPAVHVDLQELAEGFGATLIREQLMAVDPEARVATMTSGARIDYDELLVAVGAWPSLPYGGAQTLGFGSLQGALAAGCAGSVAIVVPPGTGWTLPAYQLALQVAARASGRVAVITPEHTPLAEFGRDAGIAAAKLLAEHGVAVIRRTPVPIGTDVAEFADTVLSLPLLHGPALAGLTATAAGFHAVDERQRVAESPLIHIVGDATHGRIKQGGLAAQQAEVAAADIADRAGCKLEPEPYAPVLRGKLVAPDGDTLYLRRALDGDDPGRCSPTPLWRPPGMLCAWRLTGWLDLHRAELDGDPLQPVARPWPGAALAR